MSWRESASLLLATGHPDAWQYPLGRLAFEAEIVRRRQDLDLAAYMTTLQSAVASVLSEKGQKSFKDRLKQLLRR